MKTGKLIMRIYEIARWKVERDKRDQQTSAGRSEIDQRARSAEQTRRNSEARKKNNQWLDKGPYQSPLGGYRLVRVQDGFWGIQPENNGTVSLVRSGHRASDIRRTIHFTINGIVNSHAQGNWDNAGVVIIADPKQFDTQPYMANFQDIWFYVDNKNKINIGKPIILAPTGSTPPNGLKVKFYSGDRDQAFINELDTLGILPAEIHSHGADFPAAQDISVRPTHPDSWEFRGKVDPKQEIKLMTQQAGWNPILSGGTHYFSQSMSNDIVFSQVYDIINSLTSGNYKIGQQQDTVDSTINKIISTVDYLQKNLINMKTSQKIDKISNPVPWTKNLYNYYLKLYQYLKQNLPILQRLNQYEEKLPNDTQLTQDQIRWVLGK